MFLFHWLTLASLFNFPTNFFFPQTSSIFIFLVHFLTLFLLPVATLSLFTSSLHFFVSHYSRHFLRNFIPFPVTTFSLYTSSLHLFVSHYSRHFLTNFILSTPLLTLHCLSTFFNSRSTFSLIALPFSYRFLTIFSLLYLNQLFLSTFLFHSTLHYHFNIYFITSISAVPLSVLSLCFLSLTSLSLHFLTLLSPSLSSPLSCSTFSSYFNFTFSIYF